MPTMRCNLVCEYCHFRVEQDAKSYDWDGYEKTHHIEKEVPAEDMTKFLDRFDNLHLEFSGGEPQIYKGFREVIANMKAGSRWAVTSNTLVNPAGIDFSKCFGWTASYHAGGNREKFDEHIFWLRDNYDKISISVVVPFSMVDETLVKAITMQKRYKVRINLLRELNPGIVWTGTKEWDMVKAMHGGQYNVVEEDIPESYTFTKGWVCEGGSEYITVMPDGNVYRCYSDAMDGEPIGTIWDFTPETEPKRCTRSCYGCALDHKAHITRINLDGGE